METTRTAYFHKFYFDSLEKNHKWYSLDGITEFGNKRYVKFFDGQNWSAFSREELEYIAFKTTEKTIGARSVSEADINKTRPNFCPADRQNPLSPNECFKIDWDNFKTSMNELPWTPCSAAQSLRQRCLQYASTLPNTCYAELIENAEKLERWVRG